jgi:hypothetical protein
VGASYENRRARRDECAGRRAWRSPRAR